MFVVAIPASLAGVEMNRPGRERQDGQEADHEDHGRRLLAGPGALASPRKTMAEDLEQVEHRQDRGEQGTAAIQTCPALTVPMMTRNLEKNPPKGGMPMTEKAQSEEGDGGDGHGLDQAAHLADVPCGWRG